MRLYITKQGAVIVGEPIEEKHYPQHTIRLNPAGQVLVPPVELVLRTLAQNGPDRDVGITALAPNHEILRTDIELDVPCSNEWLWVKEGLQEIIAIGCAGTVNTAPARTKQFARVD